MTYDFYPIKTNDDTISLYNFGVGDVYHSKVGAYTEALHKYVIPSGLIEFVKENNTVRILDVCYGLGYNSRTAVNEILKINPEIKIHVTALEIDPVVLAFSAIVGCECFEKQINDLFFDAINEHVNVQEIINSYIEKTSQILPQIRKLIPKEYDLIPQEEINAKLHNIYYRSISTRISIDFFISDARVSLKNINESFDFVFFDPFTPAKVPNLWTVEIFKLLYNLLDENGNLTTYSNSSPVRAGIIEAGFYIGQTTPVGKKSTGTIAYKKPELVKNQLSEKESGILKTTAGIPYRDENFSSSIEEILERREIEKQKSGRMSSSRFLKNF
ncbi:MAG: hypothetical protein A2Y25_02675 [Candidatus Melainabacteria bacterium GWF2_37_15]|nr:MAG: hypothetical protein A2Y25_02675 [Candidatus Melainabacteria bacterium GWF2_37_15]